MYQAYLLLSKDELDLECIKVNEHLAKVLTREYCEHSLSTCLDFKGCLVRLGWHLQELSAWALCDTKGHSLPQDSSRAQPSPLALAGLSIPVSCPGMVCASSIPICTSPGAQAHAEWRQRQLCFQLDFSLLSSFSSQAPGGHRGGHDLTVLLSQCKGRPHLQPKHLVSVPLYDTF